MPSAEVRREKLLVMRGALCTRFRGWGSAAVKMVRWQ
jgi:hypothetical protein